MDPSTYHVRKGNTLAMPAFFSASSSVLRMPTVGSSACCKLSSITVVTSTVQMRPSSWTPYCRQASNTLFMMAPMCCSPLTSSTAPSPGPESPSDW